MTALLWLCGTQWIIKCKDCSCTAIHEADQAEETELHKEQKHTHTKQSETAENTVSTATHTAVSAPVVNAVDISSTQLPRLLSNLRAVQVETSIKLQHGVLVLRDLRTPLELPRHLIAARKAFPAIGGTKGQRLLVTSTI